MVEIAKFVKNIQVAWFIGFIEFIELIKLIKLTRYTDLSTNQPFNHST